MTMKELWGMILIYSRVRVLSWPFFVLFAYMAAEALPQAITTLNHQLPFTGIWAVLAIADYIYLSFVGLVVTATLYFGYRCVANEADHSALTLNKYVNEIFLTEINRLFKRI